MRVISGDAKGTILHSLEGDNTRPTLDRVKEALFNIIQMKIQNSEILDLFSGSGSLAIEALSRGAKMAVLCDKSKEAIKIIEKNIEKTHLQEKAIILNYDYIKALNFLKNKFKFDLIFLDPPYDKDMIKNSIDEIISLNLLKEDGTIIIETDNEKRIFEQIQNSNINVCDLRKYGRVKLIFLNRKG